LSLHPADSAELTDLLRLLRDWLTADDAVLRTSLATWIGNSAYSSGDLARDLDRFVVLLDGTADGDGATLFTNRT
jgi:hypothetical protein